VPLLLTVESEKLTDSQGNPNNGREKWLYSLAGSLPETGLREEPEDEKRTLCHCTTVVLKI
jgi:hypothetical protein